MITTPRCLYQPFQTVLETKNKNSKTHQILFTFCDLFYGQLKKKTGGALNGPIE